MLTPFVNVYQFSVLVGIVGFYTSAIGSPIQTKPKEPAPNSQQNDVADISVLYSENKKYVIYRNTNKNECYVDDAILANQSTSAEYSRTLFVGLKINQSHKLYSEIGQEAINFCNGSEILLLEENPPTVGKIASTSTKEYKRTRRQASYTNKRSAGYRGQTQTQFVSFEKPNERTGGSAEAIAEPDKSHARVSGTAGMGQAQSQSANGDSCVECYKNKDTVREFESRDSTDVSGYTRQISKPNLPQSQSTQGEYADTKTPDFKPSWIHSQGGTDHQQTGQQIPEGRRSQQVPQVTDYKQILQGKSDQQVPSVTGGLRIPQTSESAPEGVGSSPHMKEPTDTPTIGATEYHSPEDKYSSKSLISSYQPISTQTHTILPQSGGPQQPSVKGSLYWSQPLPAPQQPTGIKASEPMSGDSIQGSHKLPTSAYPTYSFQTPVLFPSQPSMSSQEHYSPSPVYQTGFPVQQSSATDQTQPLRPSGTQFITIQPGGSEKVDISSGKGYSTEKSESGVGQVITRFPQPDITFQTDSDVRNPPQQFQSSQVLYPFPPPGTGSSIGEQQSQIPVKGKQPMFSQFPVYTQTQPQQTYLMAPGSYYYPSTIVTYPQTSFGKQGEIYTPATRQSQGSRADGGSYSLNPPYSKLQPEQTFQHQTVPGGQTILPFTYDRPPASGGDRTGIKTTYVPGISTPPKEVTTYPSGQVGSPSQYPISGGSTGDGGRYGPAISVPSTGIVMYPSGTVGVPSQYPISGGSTGEGGRYVPAISVPSTGIATYPSGQVSIPSQYPISGGSTADGGRYGPGISVPSTGIATYPSGQVSIPPKYPISDGSTGDAGQYGPGISVPSTGIATHPSGTVGIPSQYPISGGSTGDAGQYGPGISVPSTGIATYPSGTVGIPSQYPISGGSTADGGRYGPGISVPSTGITTYPSGTVGVPPRYPISGGSTGDGGRYVPGISIPSTGIATYPSGTVGVPPQYPISGGSTGDAGQYGPGISAPSTGIARYPSGTVGVPPQYPISGGTTGVDTSQGTSVTHVDSEHGEAQSLSNIQIEGNDTKASASSEGKTRNGAAQTKVSGTYTGPFSAQAQTSDNEKMVQSEIFGNTTGAVSLSQGRAGKSYSQTQIRYSYENGATSAEAQGNGINYNTNTQIQAGLTGGLADAQSSGPGNTSSQAQIGFLPHDDTEKEEQKSFFNGGGTASSQSGSLSGQSETQMRGSFQYGVSYTGAAQSSVGKSIQNSTTRSSIHKFSLPQRPIQRQNDKQQSSEIKNRTVANGENGNNANSNANLNQQTSTIRSSYDEGFVNTVTPHSANNSTAHYIYDTTESAAATKTGDIIKSDENRLTIDTRGMPEEDVADDEDYNSSKEQDAHQPHYNKKKSVNEFFNGRRNNIATHGSSGNVPIQTQSTYIRKSDNHDVYITRDSSNRLKEGDILQPGQVVPGTGNYRIPAGFRGKITSIAGDKTEANASPGGQAQTQTVIMKPGSGRVTVTDKSQTRRLPDDHFLTPTTDFQRDKITNVRSSPPRTNPYDTYVTVTKSETGELNNGDQKYVHTYYTKSSTCGYFTFTCNLIHGSKGSSTKVCKPNPPTRSDGTPC